MLRSPTWEEEKAIMIASEHLNLIQNMVRHHLAGEVVDVADKTPGFSGSFVYVVDVMRTKNPLRCVAKFTPAESSQDSSISNRVYGSQISSFGAAYACLRQNQIPVPQLYAEYNPEPGIPFYYQLMEFLPGQDIHQVLKSTPQGNQPALQQFLAKHLGTIHRITRSFDGWVDLVAPHPLGWQDAFFTALYQQLESACNHAAVADQRLKIMRTVADYRAQWTDPTGFVLSHLDGLQGMVEKTSTGWKFMGVLDIEDHSFTDQRFVLSTFELEAEIQDVSILPGFWAAYKEQTTLDPTYRKLRPLFQLYVLLDWIAGQPPEQEQIARELSHKIAARCKPGDID